MLMVCGVVLMLVPAGYLWWSDVTAETLQEQAVVRISDRLDSVGPAHPQDTTAGMTTEPPAYAEPIGIVYVPRFGEDYARPVMEGAGADVLDTLGLGHYPATAMPGELGNFAVAGHRQSNGKALDRIHTLRPGDRIHVRTNKGYYTYSYRDSEIVAPEETRVLAPNPVDPAAAPAQRLLTLTTCHPRYGTTERHVARAVLTAWRPASSGPPAEIATAVAAATRS